MLVEGLENPRCGITRCDANKAVPPHRIATFPSLIKSLSKDAILHLQISELRRALNMFVPAPDIMGIQIPKQFLGLVLKIDRVGGDAERLAISMPLSEEWTLNNISL